MIPTLIYCGSGNKRFDEIAMLYFKLGARCGTTVYYPIYFADQNWKKPDKQKYIAFIHKHKPVMSTVVDWISKPDLSIVLEWAEEISSIVDKIIVIPKIVSGVDAIPDTINGKEVILGYSVPTKYGKTITPLWEFGNRKVHLLGGSPQKQYEMSKYLNVVSLDGNMSLKMATQYCAFWNTDKYKSKTGHWQQLHEIGIKDQKDAIYQAFEMSCKNIYNFWQD